MATARFAVLDDNTRHAEIIGYAATAEEAAEVYMAYSRERMDSDDFASMARPAFAYRAPSDNAAGVEAFEPLF